jgi:hypothetical protein
VTHAIPSESLLRTGWRIVRLGQSKVGIWVNLTSAPTEWIVYSSEGHGWREFENKVDFWSRTEKFLAKYIGPSSLQN